MDLICWFQLIHGLCAYVISAILFTVLRVCALRKKLIYDHIYGFKRMLLRSSSPKTMVINFISLFLIVFQKMEVILHLMLNIEPNYPI